MAWRLSSGILPLLMSVAIRPGVTQLTRMLSGPSSAAMERLAAVKGDKTISELASLHGVHPTMIHAWKKQLVENAEEVFQTGTKSCGAEHEALQAQLYEQIGRLNMELDWLKKKAGIIG